MTYAEATQLKREWDAKCKKGDYFRQINQPQFVYIQSAASEMEQRGEEFFVWIPFQHTLEGHDLGANVNAYPAETSEPFPRQPRHFAQDILNELFTDRKGLKHIWQDIDAIVKREIKKKITGMIDTYSKELCKK